MRRMGFIVILALCAACTPSKPMPELTSTDRRIDLNMDMRGAVAATVDHDVQARFKRLINAPSPEVELLALEMRSWIDVDSVRVKPVFTLVGYHGDGRYAVTPLTGATPAAGSSLSSAMLEFQIGDDVRTYRQYRGACTVEIKNDGLRGSMQCPVLQNEERKQISLNLSWGPAT